MLSLNRFWSDHLAQTYQQQIWPQHYHSGLNPWMGNVETVSLKSKMQFTFCNKTSSWNCEIPLMPVSILPLCSYCVTQNYNCFSHKSFPVFFRQLYSQSWDYYITWTRKPFVQHLIQGKWIFVINTRKGKSWLSSKFYVLSKTKRRGMIKSGLVRLTIVSAFACYREWGAT